MQFPLDHQWLALPQDQALGHRRAWAVDAVQSLNTKGADIAVLEPLVAHLEAVADHYLKVGGLGCLLLLPDGRLPVRAMVRLESFAGPADVVGFREQCDLLMPPMSWLVDPVEVSAIDSTAGPVTRLHVRTADPGLDVAPVRDDLYWLWWFPQDPSTYLASASFADVTDAALFAQIIEETLVLGVRDDGARSTAGELPEGAYASA